MLVVNPALPVKTLQEFIAYVKARPGQIDYASSGNGSGQHLFVALLASMTGMQDEPRAVRGSGQATTDLLGGQVHGVDSRDGRHGRPHQGRQAARARGHRRARARRSCPTCRRWPKSGVPGYEAYVWMGLLAPKGTPAAIVERLHRELVAALGDAGGQGATWPAPASRSSARTPAEFGTFFRAERDRWAKVIRETGAKVD